VYLPESFPQQPDKTPANFAEFQLRERFAATFSHSWDFILKETPDAPWKTVNKYRLTPQKLWYRYTDPNKILGVRFDTQTNYALYDIDISSLNHPALDENPLQKLTWELENWGINRLVFLQSSFSQGLHLYFFFSKPVCTFKLACVMKKAAHDAGLTLKNGHLEAFPNTKTYNRQYQGHRLPLQEGSFLLDKDFVPYSDRLEDFLDAAEESATANDVDLLESRLEEADAWYKEQKRQYRHVPPQPVNNDLVEQIDDCEREIDEGFLYQIRLAVEKGFDGYHQTNDLLLTIGKLGRLAHGLSGKHLAEYIYERAVSSKGYTEYCRHKHEIRRRSREVARWAERKWSPFGTYPKERVTYRHIKESLPNRINRNDERKYNAQNRIIQAIAHLEKEHGTLPRLVGQRMELLRITTKELFGISVSDVTLKKAENLPLWHPKHRQEAQEVVPASVEPEPPVEESSESELPPEPPISPSVPEEHQDTTLQSVLLPEQPADKPSEEGDIRCAEVRKNGKNPESPEPSSVLDSENFGYPLPYMKGLMNVPSDRVYQYHGTVQIATVWKPGAIIEFESIQPKQIIEILEFQNSQKNPTKILQEAVYADVRPKNSDWESGILIRLSHLEPYDLPYE
jgi:hypothetical protein